MKELDAQEAADLVAAVSRGERRALADALRAERREMLALAAAERVDPEAVANAMARVRAATTRLQEAAHETILKSVEASATTRN